MRNDNVLMRRPVLSGLVMLAVAAVATVLLFQKSAIITWITPGQTLTVEMTRDYKITPYASVVKIAGTKVGVVESVDRSDDGPVRMTLKLQRGTRELLGTAPSVVVRPTTVLGGSYYVQLYPGGDPGRATSDVIPAARTRLPVELDRLLSAVPPNSQRGLQGMTASLDDTFKAGVGRPLDTLLAHAPATLGPAGTVADALRGQNRDADLATMVNDLDSASRTLSARPGQLRSVVDSLADTARVLGANAVPVDQTIATLPATLHSTRTGADDLAGMLQRLTDTASDARPSVRELDPLLRRLDPTLGELRPVLDDLHPLLRDARPLVEQLVPTVDRTTGVLHDLDGPVLDRVNGPILGELNGRWRGLAPKFPQGGDGSRFYQQLGYMFAHIDSAVQYQNATSHMLGFQPGAGSTSVYGTGATAQQLQDLMSEGFGPPHRAAPTPIGPPLPQGVPVPDPGVASPTVPGPALAKNLDPTKGMHR